MRLSDLSVKFWSLKTICGNIKQNKKHFKALLYQGGLFCFQEYRNFDPFITRINSELG